MAKNNPHGLRTCPDDTEITRRFLEGNLPGWPVDLLKVFLEQTILPLTVRSSRQLEDVQFAPCAGLVNSYMLPNNHPHFQTRLNHLLTGIKLVFASAYHARACSFSSRDHFSSGEEGMAVIIQKLAGRRHGTISIPPSPGWPSRKSLIPSAWDWTETLSTEKPRCWRELLNRNG